MLYRSMDRAALDAAYNNTAAVGQAKRKANVADWTRRSATSRDAPGARVDLRSSTAATGR
jgi:arylformamidase